MLRAVANIGTDAAAIIPKGMELEFIEAAKGSGSDFHEKLAKFLEQQISKAVLGQTTTTDAIAGGHAVSKEHNEVRKDIETADAVQLADTLTRAVIKPLIDLNRGPQKAYPRLRIGRAENVDLDKYTKAVELMARAGLPVSKSEVYGRLGWKPPKDVADTLVVRAPSHQIGKEQALQRALHSQFAVGPDSIDGLVEDMLGNWEEVMAPVVGPLNALLEGATSYDDVKERLASALNQMDTTALQDQLARAGFNARLAGETGAATRDDA